MTTNKDFQQFQKFLADQKQQQIDELSVGKAINTGTTAYMGYETGSAIKDKRYGDAVSSGLSMMPGPIGWSAAASDWMGQSAKTEKGKAQGEWVRKNVPGAETVANYMRKAGEAIGVREPSKAPEPEKPKESEPVKPTETKPAEPPQQFISQQPKLDFLQKANIGTIGTRVQPESGGRTIKTFKQFHKK
jgi:hypothetical protein